MSCGAIDIGCQIAAHINPILSFWGSIGAFIKEWWWIAYGAACMALGAHLGPARVYGIITAGLVALAIRYWPKEASTTNPELPERDQVPPVRKKKR